MGVLRGKSPMGDAAFVVREGDPEAPHEIASVLLKGAVVPMKRKWRP